MEPLGVTCPRCRAAAGEPCVGAAPHRERALAAAAVRSMPQARGEASPEEKATRAARRRQQARARDPRMNNDW